MRLNFPQSPVLSNVSHHNATHIIHNTISHLPSPTSQTIHHNTINYQTNNNYQIPIQSQHTHTQSQPKTTPPSCYVNTNTKPQTPNHQNKYPIHYPFNHSQTIIVSSKPQHAKVYLPSVSINHQVMYTVPHMVQITITIVNSFGKTKT